MKHQLRNPAFPDLVEAWAVEDRIEFRPDRCVNDNDLSWAELSDPLFETLARVDIAETRAW